MTTGPGAAPQACLDVHDDFGFAVLTLSRAYLARVRLALDDGIPHGPRGYQTLTAVVQGEQPTQLALAAHLGIDRTVMTYVIDDLAAAGLVERKLNPADRRQRKIVATAKGMRALRQLQRRVAQAEEEVLGALDEAERAAFRELLGKIVRGARALAPCDEKACD
jgi:DNA-binding MarR family transcriptional regulator